MQWEIDLDSTTYQLPNNWQNVEFTIKYDRDMRIYTGSFSTDFEFTGDAYTYLMGLADSSVCSVVDVDVKWGCDFDTTPTTIFTGKIYIVDIEFNLEKCTAKAPVHDDSWNSLISNNKNIKAHLDVPRSKNDTTITVPTNQTINFFNPATGGYGGTPGGVEAYLVHEAFEFLIDFMSDGNLQYSSTLFGAGGALEGLCICTGAAINNGVGTGFAPYISFYDLFKEMYKLFNIAIRVNTSTSPPTVIIEREDIIKEPEALSAVYLTNVRNVRQSYATDLMYSLIHAGSSTTQDDQGGTFAFPDVVYLSHKAEEFHLLGDCNVDAQLDLVNTWIIDSNVIQDVAVNAVTTYDDDVFIIETDLPGSSNCTQNGTLFAGVWVYNVGLTTRDLMINYWLNALPNDIVQFLGNGNDEFRAQRTADLAVTGPNANVTQNPFQTPDDFTPPNQDPNGRFRKPGDPASGTEPNYAYYVAATGYYVMYAEIWIRNFTYTTLSPNLQVTVSFYRYNAAAVLQETKTVVTSVNADIIIQAQPTGFYATATDYIVVGVQAQDISPGVKDISCTITDDSFVQCIQAENGGGVFQTFDLDKYYVKVFNFEKPVPVDTFETWMGAPHRQFRFNIGSDSANDKEGFIEELVYTPQKQRAQLTVIGRNETS